MDRLPFDTAFKYIRVPTENNKIPFFHDQSSNFHDHSKYGILPSFCHILDKKIREHEFQPKFLSHI